MAETNVIRGEVDRVFTRLGISGMAAAILMILAGILLLVFPELVAYVLGLYLIIVGLLQLMAHLDQRPREAPPAPTAPGYPPPSPPPSSYPGNPGYPGNPPPPSDP